MVDVRVIMILMLFAGAIIGYQYGIYSKDCQRDYNRGYGDALYFALEHQRMSMKMDREWDMHPNYSHISNYSGINMNYTNASWQSKWVNMSMNLSSMNFTGTDFSNCRQNETGHNASDLVMHITC